MTCNVDIAFTPAVQDIQAQRGSRRAYAAMAARGGFRDTISDDLAAFVAEQTSMFLATANAAGQPYVQHRGGPRGFLRVLDERTLGFADYRGNRQYISLGNLAENPRAFLFLIDYAAQRRIKIWGSARVETEDTALIGRLMPPHYDARPEQAIVFTVEAWDENCPQHIPRLYSEDEMTRRVAGYETRIADLQAQLARA